MYLTPNFDKFTVPSYIGTQSSSAFIRIINAWELRSAARAELKKHSPVVDADGLYQDADQAFAALENVLKRKNRMADAENRAPSLLEATAFAYLFLLLETLYTAWADTRLVDVVRKYPELEKVEVALNASHFGALKPPQLYLR
jgi:metaxin